MITHVATKGFKGFDIDEDVPQYALYTGRNKSGKSTRSEAIAIALYGYIPFSSTGKKPGDILSSFGSGKNLTTSVTCNGVVFERKISRSEKGNVTQTVKVNGKRSNSGELAVAMDKAGIPRIVDVVAFMDQSDQKKVDDLFNLFPVEADIANIDDEIESAKKKVSKLEKDKKATEAVIKRLVESKSGMELPAGTLAEVQAEIAQKTEMVKKLQEDIKQAEIAEAEERAIAKTEAEAERKAIQEESRRAEEKKHGQEQQSLPMHNSLASTKTEPIIGIDQANGKDEAVVSNYVHAEFAASSIKKIISAMESAGCEVCAALIVAKQELKKYNQEVG